MSSDSHPTMLAVSETVKSSGLDNLKEFMVRLQTFNTHDNLLKNNCFDNNQLQDRKKNFNKLFYSIEISKNIMNDSLDGFLL